MGAVISEGREATAAGVEETFDLYILATVGPAGVK